MTSLMSFPRKRESIFSKFRWIPAFAGMTIVGVFFIGSSSLWAAAPTSGFFAQGTDLYKAGRYSDAVDAFEQAMSIRINAARRKLTSTASAKSRRKPHPETAP